jgi:malate dehydrogenase (oxaloacetate-decarboxylating)(NADP+)
MFASARARGLYLSKLDRGHMHAAVANWPHIDVHVLVVTDGSRILGLGDLGANGMGIPIGKLSLYCAAGGIAPHRVLPVMLDCGTDNEDLLKDPYYIGIQEPRLRGKEYFEVVDEFMDAVRSRYPNAFIQFEDFSSDVASKILTYYRDDECHKRQPVCVFNDDIQGTGAVTLAGIMSGLVNKGESVHDLANQRVLIAGAGSAGIGVASMLAQGMMSQGLSEEEALKNFCIVDKDGLLAEDDDRKYFMEQKKFVRKPTAELKSGMNLVEVCKAFKPTILMGLSAVGGLFKEELIREMAKVNESPFIFPLSNPTKNAEVTAEDAFKWSDGRCIFASGSPFPSVTLPDGSIKHISQCNNMFIFPGIGLAVSSGRLTKVSDEMLYAASVAVANSLSDQDRKEGRVYPKVSDIREVSVNVAVAVCKKGIEQGYSKLCSVSDIPTLRDRIVKKMYHPHYVPLVERTARRTFG